MIADQIIANGFSVTIETITTTEKVASETLSSQQILATISRFIEDHIPKNANLRVKLSLKHWDDVYSVEESVVDLRNNASGIGNADHCINYWIGDQL